MLKFEFQSKHPHHTAWLRVEGPVQEYEAAEKDGGVLYDLKNIGWLPYEITLPDFNRTRSRDFGKPGSDLFNSWNTKEKKKFMIEARRVLKKHGIDAGPVHQLSLAELL